MKTPETTKGLIAWFAANHVAANLLMVLIVVTGLFSIATITKKAMPDIDLPIIQVRVAFPGASPADVESGIVVQVEKAIDDVDGITRVSSVASEGSASVNIELDESYDVNDVLNDVKVRVDSILTFPLDAEPPIVSRTVVRNDALRLEVYGDMDPVSQKELAQQIRDELLDLPNVTSVTLAGARPYEISIEVPEDTLLKYGLSLDQVAQRIRQTSLDLPAGSLDTDGGEILVRTQSLAYDYQDFDRIVLLTTSLQPRAPAIRRPAALQSSEDPHVRRLDAAAEATARARGRRRRRCSSRRTRLGRERAQRRQASVGWLFTSGRTSFGQAR